MTLRWPALLIFLVLPRKSQQTMHWAMHQLAALRGTRKNKAALRSVTSFSSMNSLYDDESNESDESWNDDMEDMSTDPFEGLSRSEQDLFFRVLDVIPDDKRTDAVEYFMDHPNKIRAVIQNVKQKKELIEQKDIEGLKKVLEEEQIVLEKIATGTYVDPVAA